LESYVKRFPHCKYALVFHESGGGPYPLEIFGEKTEIAPEQKVRDQEKAERALFQAEMIRKYAPGVKIVIGNNGGATEGLLAQLFREKFPREKMDFLGNEAGGGSYAPEYELSHGNWALKKLGEIYGYKDLNPDACYEWHSRRIRFFDNAARHAAVCMRDMLLSHAWHQNAAPSVCIQDTGVAYDCTTWG